MSDVPQVARYYLDEAGRREVRVRSFSKHGLSRDVQEQWVLVQNAHVYFETAELIAQLRGRHSPVERYDVAGVTVLEVFRLASN